MQKILKLCKNCKYYKSARFLKYGIRASDCCHPKNIAINLEDGSKYNKHPVAFLRSNGYLCGEAGNWFDEKCGHEDKNVTI